MSSPNEPGYPRASDGPGANGSVTGPLSAGSPTGHAADSGDAPPWQRGPAARAARPHLRQPQESPARTEAPRAGSAAGHSPSDTAGLDARLNRFIAGGPASPAPTHRSRAARRRRRRAPSAQRRRAPRPTPVNSPTSPVRRRDRRSSASRCRSAPRRNQRAGRRRPPAASRWAPATKARCGPACRSGGSTRGAR